MEDNQLIFIVSQPRAGSTLLQALLSNNEAVNTVSEPWLLLVLAPLLKPPCTITPFDYGIACDAMKEFERQFPSVLWKDKIRQLALDAYQTLLKDGYTYVLDKTPRYYEILDEILELFPNAKLIILKRNPLHVVLSLIKKRKIDNASDLLWNHRDILNAPFTLNTFLKNQRHNPNVLSLRYEDVLANPKQEIQNLYQQLGIPFHPRVLDINLNEKIHGKFGDPNLQKMSNKQVIVQHSEPKLNECLSNFLSGYTHFLGIDFMQEYGKYKPDIYGNKKTKEFTNFFDHAKSEMDIFTKSIHQKFNLGQCD